MPFIRNLYKKSGIELNMNSFAVEFMKIEWWVKIREIAGMNRKFSYLVNAKFMYKFEASKCEESKIARDKWFANEETNEKKIEKAGDTAMKKKIIPWEVIQKVMTIWK